MTKLNLRHQLSTQNLPILCGALFIVTLICGVITYSMSYKLSHLPQDYLHAQNLYQTSLDAQSSLKQARLSENKQDLLPHLDRLESSMTSMITDPILSKNMSTDQVIDQESLNALIHDLKQYNDLKTRLRTYLYVVDNAHQEFAQKHNTETDRSYFDLVTNTDGDTNVSKVVNEYVTPLISTSQLGNDVHLIVANLEKTGAATQLSNVNNLEKDVQNALKRINAAFSLNDNDTNLSNLEDITFQIISFAYGPNNIFEIKRSILNLDNDIATSLRAYDQSFAQISAITDNLRREYAANLYANIDHNATFLQIMFAINAILFAVSMATLLMQYNVPAENSADHAHDGFAHSAYQAIQSANAFWSDKITPIFSGLKKDMSDKIEDAKRKKHISPIITAPEYDLADNSRATEDQTSQSLNYQDILAKIDAKNTDDMAQSDWKDNDWTSTEPSLELMPDNELPVFAAPIAKGEAGPITAQSIETSLEFEPDDIPTPQHNALDQQESIIEAPKDIDEPQSKAKYNSSQEMDLDMILQRQHARMDSRQSQASENESVETPPLLLDTTMRVAAQRERLKKALTGLDTAQRSEIYKANTPQSLAKQALQTPHGKKNLEDIISMIKQDQQYQASLEKSTQDRFDAHNGQSDIDDDLNDFDADFSNSRHDARRA